MAQVLPLQPSIAFYRFSTALDSVPYIFDVRWNGRDAAWYMDISDEAENPIGRGIKIVLGANLGQKNRTAAFPAGAFVAIDASGQGRDAGFDDIGSRVIVVFLSVADLEAIADG